MKTLSPQLMLLLNVSVAQSQLSRRFDGRLASLGLTEFIILHQLSQAPQHKLRRVDLAEQVGLTASAITRLLAPMEKIGLVSKEANEFDARVSFVVLAPGGRQMFEESIENAEALAEALLQSHHKKSIETANDVLLGIGGTIRG